MNNGVKNLTEVDINAVNTISNIYWYILAN